MADQPSASGPRDEPDLVPELRFPEFRASGSWVRRPLSSLCSPITRKVGSLRLTPVSITAGVGFVSQASKFGRDISGVQYRSYTHLKKGDFAYNRGNSKRFPQGYACELVEFDEAAASSAFLCFALADGLEKRFLQALFDENALGPQLAREISSSARSDGLLNIKPDGFYSVEVPLPPDEEEQRRIAACLSSLDALVDAEDDRLAALEDLRRGLFQQVFPREGEGEPRLRHPSFRSEGDWLEAPLLSVASYENGKAYEPHIVEEGRYAVVNARFISTDGAVRKWTDHQAMIASRDDILMVLSDLPNGRALAKCFLVDADDRYAVNQRVCRIRASGIESRYLYYALNRHPYLLGFDDGLNQTHLAKGDVLACPIRYPRDPLEQSAIAEGLRALDARIAEQKLRLEALRRHRKGLVQTLYPRLEEDQEEQEEEA